MSQQQQAVDYLVRMLSQARALGVDFTHPGPGIVNANDTTNASFGITAARLAKRSA